MSTQAEVDAYYAEIEAGKHRIPSAQEEAFARMGRQDDEQREREAQKRERPGPGRPSLTAGTDTTPAKDSTMTQTITTTQAALTIAYGKATERYPNEQARILKSAQIAAQPFDVIEHDGYAAVKSSDGKREYTVNGACDCPDPTPRCKHRYAVALHRKAASIHKAMLAPEHCHAGAVGSANGIVHIVDDAWFHVPYGGPRGYFTTSADCVLGSCGTDWHTVQIEKEKYEAAYYAEYDEVA